MHWLRSEGKKLAEEVKRATFAENSSFESQDPIFNNAVKAGAAAEPNSNEEASSGSSCRNQKMLHESIGEALYTTVGWSLSP